MRIKFVIGLFICLCFFLTLFSQEPEELIAQADELYNQMKDMGTAQTALEKYRQALMKAENKYEAYWKVARIMYFIGAHTEKKKEKKTIFSQGIYHAKKAVALEPEMPDGYYWLGVNYGVYGEARGVLKSLFLVDDIKEAMNKVIELDRSYEDGGPDRVMGRVYFKLPGFAGGNKDKSLEHLKKSLEYGPEDALTHFYLADTLLKHKEIEKAREELEYVLNMEDDPRWIVDIARSKKDAEELLKDKKFREKKK